MNMVSRFREEQSARGVAGVLSKLLELTREYTLQPETALIE